MTCAPTTSNNVRLLQSIHSVISKAVSLRTQVVRTAFAAAQAQVGELSKAVDRALTADHEEALRHVALANGSMCSVLSVRSTSTPRRRRPRQRQRLKKSQGGGGDAARAAERFSARADGGCTAVQTEPLAMASEVAQRDSWFAFPASTSRAGRRSCGVRRRCLAPATTQTASLGPAGGHRVRRNSLCTL
mgnify:FL=1